MTRIAVIDLGTNTFNLLIADSEIDTFNILFSEEIPVKLGEGGINAGLITPEAWSRGFTAIHYIQQKITGYQCEKVKAVATSAIRSATNGRQFTRSVKEATGIDIEIIDGNTEARLIYEGVRQAVSMDKMSLIMDIGGGSVEFIICDQSRLYWQASYPVGAARLREKFHHSDPVDQKDIEQIEKYLAESLPDLFEQCTIHNPQCLIGSAGAFESFAEIVSRNYDRHFDKNNSEFSFEIEEFNKIASEIVNADHSTREKMPGLIAFRIDMIVAATVLTQYILRRTHIRSLKLSTYALKEGILVNAGNSLNKMN